jgi:hypothetical protein
MMIQIFNAMNKKEKRVLQMQYFDQVRAKEFWCDLQATDPNHRKQESLQLHERREIF